jgi:hypothetical protein
MMKTFDDFVMLADDEMDMRHDATRDRILSLLGAKGLTERDVELYINFPAMTEQELADHFDIGLRKVSRRLAKMRNAWPGLRFDTTLPFGDPDLTNMTPIENDSDIDLRGAIKF